MHVTVFTLSTLNRHVMKTYYVGVPLRYRYDVSFASLPGIERWQSRP
jgi:hypothetical protein